MRRPLTSVLFVTLAAGLVAPPPLDAQATSRRITTVSALAAYPAFFHGQTVVVRAEPIGEEALVWLVHDEARVVTLAVPPPVSGTRETLDVSGRFWDVGRLESTDPRLAEQDVTRLSETLLEKPWPAPGEMLLLVADEVHAAQQGTEPTLRNMVLEPARFQDQVVTIVGRFRGRNLYGDLPEAAGKSRWDFVVISGDSPVWVTGKEPEGDGFELDVQARVDTNQWLEVTGTLRVERAMVLIEATTLALAEAPDDAPETTAPEVRQGPRPEVIFSTPVDDDVDIDRETVVRIQFSRDIDAATLDGHVQIAYPTGPSSDPAASPEVRFTLEYRGLNRVLEIQFDEPLEPFRILEIELQEGILATDGASLVPWSLQFQLGR